MSSCLQLSNGSSSPQRASKMLPRRFSSSARTTYEAVRPSLVSYGNGSMLPAIVNADSRAAARSLATPSRRSIHTSGTRLAVNVPQRERTLLAELRALRKMVEEDDKTQFAKESTAHLPPLTEDTLATLYQAINMPDPPSDEEMRLEDRRRRLLGGGAGPTSLERKMRRASRRIEDVSRRLGELKLLNQPAHASLEADHSKRLVQILQGVKETEQKEEAEFVELERKETEEAAQSSATPVVVITTRSVLAQIEKIITSLRRNMPADSPISLGLLTKQDWRALARWCAGANQLDSLPRLFALMEVSGQGSLQLDVANVALDMMAEEGDVAMCHSLAEVMQDAGLEYDDYTRHCLVKAYVHSERLSEAISMLRSFAESVPASLSTYTLTIEALLAQKTSPEVQTKAWSLFTEMRLVAHPVPDAPLYAQMIKACALGVEQPGQNIWKPSSLLSGQSRSGKFNTVQPRPGERTSDAERALDLFREMTTRYNIRPTADVFTSVILACTRRRDMYRKGIELFQNMLDLERARIKGNDSSLPSFAPSRIAYNSLLQGCARNGDLLRARWVLAEMLRSSMALSATLRRKGDAAQEWEWREAAMRRPDEETLALVLLTYATYKIPMASKQMLTKTDSDAGKTDSTMTEGSKEEQRAEVRIHDSTHDNQSSTFSGTQLPGSSLAVLSEADGLLQRVASDQGDPDRLLSSVKPNGRMLQAYLAVVDAHGNRDRLWRMRDALFGNESSLDGHDPLDLGGMSLYERWGVPIDAMACEAVLEACVKWSNREEADGLARRTWEAWQQTCNRSSTGSGSDVVTEARIQSFEPVFIGRCWAGMINNEAKSNRLTEAMELLRTFVHQYPPPPRRPTESHEPPTGATAAANYPLLTFKQLQVLHRRLTARIQASQTFHMQSDDERFSKMMEERQRCIDDLALLSWATRSYGAILVPRMPKIIKNAGRYVEMYKRPDLQRRT